MKPTFSKSYLLAILSLFLMIFSNYLVGCKGTYAGSAVCSVGQLDMRNILLLISAVVFALSVNSWKQNPANKLSAIQKNLAVSGLWVLFVIIFFFSQYSAG